MSNEIIHMLLTDRQKAFEQLYEKAFPLVARFVSRMGGSYDDARDIFQDALIVLYEKAVDESPAIRVSVQAYVLGIAKHLWSRKYRAQQYSIPLDALEKDISVPADFYTQQETESRLMQYLETAGKKCMELLQQFYYHQLSMQDIARRFGFGNTRSATVQKFKCLEKVRQQLKTTTYEEIFE